MEKWYTTLIVFTLLHYALSTNSIYVSSTSTCASTCDGTTILPYDNLFNALKKASLLGDATIILMGSSSAVHYLIEDTNPMVYNSNSWTLTGSNRYFNIFNLIIKPLFCTDQAALNEPTLLAQCISPIQKTTVYLKTTNFTVYIQGAIAIQNIIFDAIEDISNWESTSTTDLNDCLHNKKKCCQLGTSISTSHPITVSCGWTTATTKSWINPTNSIFELTNNGASTLTSRSLSFVFIEINNFQTPYLRSFIEVGPLNYVVSIGQSIASNIIFNNGLISSTAPDTSTASTFPTNTSSIIITDFLLANYNIWSIQMQSIQRHEGYLFYASNTFQGLFKILRSNFANAVSSLRNSCWAQTVYNYARPMNNLLIDEKRSRSDLWSQYHENRAKNDYVSSLIYFKAIYGAVAIDTCNFNNIIGTSGSVLRVDDVISSNTWFIVSSSIFNATFAYDSFANIMIAKVSDPKFSSMLSCPYLQISGSKFLYTYGCPGAYGNILSLCYWDTQPSKKGSLSDYSLSSQGSLLAAAWMSPSLDNARNRVTACIFMNNLMAVSNSLAFIGAYFTVLQYNAFQGNGGTSAGIASYSLMNSYFSQRYPTGVAQTLNNAHFGQSTMVYFDHMIKFYTTANVYSQNWGPWEGSLALSTLITIKNWINIFQSMKFIYDRFTQNQGYPSAFDSFLDPSGFASNTYMDPLITISVDSDANAALSSIPTLAPLFSQRPTLIDFEYVTFDQNNLNFNYTEYTYNSGQLDWMKNYVIAVNTRYQTGLVKLLWASEAIDDISNGFKSDPKLQNKIATSFNYGMFVGNQLLSMGCMMTDVAFIRYSQIVQNVIYAAGETFIIFFVGQTYKIAPETKNQGFFCVGTTEFLGDDARLQLMVDNTIVRMNLGVIFNAFTDTKASLYFSNCLFISNACKSLGTIVSRATTSVTQINTMFLSNQNYMGNNYLYMSSKFITVNNTYLYNTGKYASITYMETVTISYECLMQMNRNTIYSDYIFSTEVMIPQSGLYYGSYSTLNIFKSVIRDNNAFSGLITFYGGTAAFYDCQILDHYIYGTSVMGTYLSLANLHLTNVLFDNNVIHGKTDLADTQPALIALLTAGIEFKNVVIQNGAAIYHGMLIFGNVVDGTIDNMTVTNFISDKYNSPLLYLSYSSINITNTKFSIVTGLFNFIASVININSMVVTNVTNDANSQYLWDISASTIFASGVSYIGYNPDYSKFKPLITGEDSRLILINSHFIDATNGVNSVISFKNSDRIFVMNCIFEYSKVSNDVTVFTITGEDQVRIQNNVIIFAGSVLSLEASNNLLLFTGNTIITYSQRQSININGINATYISDNIIMRQFNDHYTALPVSQVQIVDVLTRYSITRNTFIGLYGTTGILDIETGSLIYQCDISQNTFINNLAVQGGALYLSAAGGSSSLPLPSANILYSTFVKNHAVNRNNMPVGKGGAFYQQTSDETSQSTIFDHCIFISNSADTTGGAIYFDYSLPVLSSNSIFIENFALRLNHISSYPVKVTLLPASASTDTIFIPGSSLPKFTKQQEYYSWTNIVSGAVDTDVYKFAIMDVFGQVIFSDSSSKLNFDASGFGDLNKSAFSTLAPIPANQGTYLLTDFKFKYKVDQSINVTFSSTAVTPFNATPITGLAILPSVMVQMTFRQCGTGQFAITEGSITTCQSCPVGFWYIDPYKTASTCTACEATSTICRGGNDVGPRAGYWRLNTTASLVLPCPRKESCVGNSNKAVTLNPLGTCAPTYQGNLCYSCIKGWAKDSQGNCTNCKTNAISYMLFIIVIIIQAVLIGYGVRETMNEGAEYTGNKKEEEGVDSSILLRIFMNYSQIFSLLVAIPISWPSVLDSSLSVSIKTSAIGDQLLSFDCFFNSKHSQFSSRTVFFKALFIALNPFCFIFIGLIAWVSYFKYKRRSIFKNKDLINNVITTIVIICFENQPTIIKNSFSMLQCMNLYREDSSLLFLVQDYDVKCWEGQHLRWTLGLVIPCLILWVLAIPSFMIYILVKNKNVLDTEEMARRYSFIYNGYRPEKCYWEFSILVRKIILICVIIFGGLHSTSLQIYLFFIVILFSYIFQVKNQPYSSPILNRLETISLISLIIFNLCGLYFEVIKDTPGLSKITILAGFLGGMFFLLHFGKLFFEAQIKKLKQNKKVVQLLAYLKKKFSCCLKSKRLQKLITRARTTLNWKPLKESSISEQSLAPSQNNLEPDTSELRSEPQHLTNKTPQFSRQTEPESASRVLFLSPSRLNSESDINSSRSHGLSISLVQILPKNMNTIINDRREITEPDTDRMNELKIDQVSKRMEEKNADMSVLDISG